MSVIRGPRRTFGPVCPIHWTTELGGPQTETKRRRYLEENVRAADLLLTRDDLAAIDAIAPKGAAAASR